MRALRADVTEGLKLRRGVRREVLRYLVELGMTPPNMTVADLERRLQVADLEAQYELPPPDRRKGR